MQVKNVKAEAHDTTQYWEEPGNVALSFCLGEDKVLNDCRSGKLWVQHNTTGTPLVSFRL